MKKLLNIIASHLSVIYQIIALLVTVTLILLMFPHSEKESVYNYSVGSFWSENDLFAPYDFSVIHSESGLEKEIVAAKSQLLLYYQQDSSASILSHQKLESAPFSLKEKKDLKGVLSEVYQKGYMDIPEDIPDVDNHTIVLLKGDMGAECKPNQFLKAEDIPDLVSKKSSFINNYEEVAQFLVDSVLHPDIKYDEVRTHLELNSRVSQMSYSTQMVTRGELIIAKGEFVTEEKAHVIESLEKEESDRFTTNFNNFNHYLGEFLLCIFAFLALYIFLKQTNNTILNDDRKISFVFLIVLLMAMLTALLVRVDSDLILLAPLCIAPILMRVFFDMRVALYIHLVTVIILGNLVPNSFEFIFYQLVTGIMSIITVKEFDKRSQFFTVSLVIFVSYSLIYTAGILSQTTHLNQINPLRYAIFFGNAVLTLLAHPLIFLFEKLFRLTTNLTLLEISSTNTEALRQLSRKAPGTFQHSMQVANISEDLINEIGGNALLARVGALYHDIGKIQTPLFFTENQNNNFSPHENLTSEESAMAIIQHVRVGIDLAKKYHLPEPVTDFIRTHHGTTKTGYFYTVWMNEHPGEDPIDSIFQYPGPTPYSKETAVVMIVDSVEAACRSLKNPTKESISELIDKLIDNKIRENQLINCDITFADISRIREFLKKKMLSIYHVRIAYPVLNSENRIKEDNNK